MVILIPRRYYRRLAWYGIFSGAVYDVFWILLLKVIGAGGYQNYGPFGFLGIPFFPPIAWTIFFMMYLYLLPPKAWSRYLLAVIAAAYSVFFSNILENLRIFEWRFGRVLFPLVLYLTWFGSVTYIYSRIKKRRNDNPAT